MFVLFSDAKRNTLTFFNLECCEGLQCKDKVISNMDNQPTQKYDTAEEALEQFNDLMDAYVSKKVERYDLREEVGYWKEEEEVKEKTAPTNGRRKSNKTEPHKEETK